MPIAIHSGRLKWPGTNGITFAKTIAEVSNTPKIAAARPRKEGFMQEYEAHAAIHPIAQPTAPTSRTGTSSASPSRTAIAVATPTLITATDGV